MLHIAHIVYKDDESKCIAEGDIETFKKDKLPAKKDASLLVVDMKHSNVFRRVHAILDAKREPQTLGAGSYGVAYLVELKHLPNIKNNQNNKPFQCTALTAGIGSNETCMGLQNSVCVLKLPAMLLKTHTVIIHRSTGAFIFDYEHSSDPEEEELNAIFEKGLNLAKDEFMNEINNNQRLLMGETAYRCGLFDMSDISMQDFRKILDERDQNATLKGYEFLHRIIDFTMYPFPCIISDYCEGDVQSLTKKFPHVWGGFKQPSPEYWQMVYSVYYGLHYMHSKGVTHSDIKPSNIFYRSAANSNEMSFVIGDFGLMDNADVSHRVLGTGLYWPPEFSDIYYKRRCIYTPLPKGATAYSFCKTMLVLLEMGYHHHHHDAKEGYIAEQVDHMLREYIRPGAAKSRAAGGGRMHPAVDFMLSIMALEDPALRFRRFTE